MELAISHSFLITEDFQDILIKVGVTMKYRLCELPELLETPRTTIRNWLTIFHEFIPVVRQGKSTFYTDDAISVLRRISSLREHLYSHSTIKEILLEEGYETVVITSVPQYSVQSIT